MFKRYMFIEGFTNLIGSNGCYLINNDGQIKDIKDNDIPITRDSEGHKVVTCLGWAGHQQYRVIDLVALQFKNLQIPLEDYDKVIAFVIDGNKDNTHASNIGYRFKGGKLEFKKIPGFYYVPGYPYCITNIEGNLINLVNLKLSNYYVSKPVSSKNIKGGYYHSSSKFIIGQPVTVSRHRMLCLTFKEYPDNVDSLTVNHINGIPGDDRLENLEWLTRGQNNLHAYVNDLKSQHKRVLVRNVLTGEVTEYYSISECARQLGYATDETIRQRLVTSKFGQVFQEGTQIKFKDDPRPWVEVDNPDEALKAARQRIPVLVRDCRDLSVKWFVSIQYASKHTNVNRATIEIRLKNNNLKPCFGYQFKCADDSTPFPDFTQQEYYLSLKPNSNKICARNLIDGSELIFDSARKAELYFGYKNIAIKLNMYKQPIYPEGWQFKHYEQYWEEVKDVEQTLYSLRRDIMARCEKTSRIIIGASSEQLGEILNLDPKAIRLAAMTRGNKVYHGYRFRLGVKSDPWPTTDLPSQ